MLSPCPPSPFYKPHPPSYAQVANEVETEQILDAGVDYRTGLPLISSLVQASRGLGSARSAPPASLPPA